MARDTPHGWTAPQSYRPKERTCDRARGHMWKPFHPGHMDRVAAICLPKLMLERLSEAHDVGRGEGQDVPLVRPSSCNVKGGIPSSQRYLPTSKEGMHRHYLTCTIFFGKL